TIVPMFSRVSPLVRRRLRAMIRDRGSPMGGAAAGAGMGSCCRSTWVSRASWSSYRSSSGCSPSSSSKGPTGSSPRCSSVAGSAAGSASARRYSSWAVSTGESLRSSIGTRTMSHTTTMAKYRGELLITPPHDDGHWTLLDTCRHRATWWRRNPRNSDVPRRDIVPELGSDRGESHPPYPRVARIVNASMFRTVRPRVHKCATFCPECRKIVDLQFRTLYGSEAKAQVRSKLQRVASIKHKVMGCVRKEWFSAVGLQLPVNLSPRARVWTHPGHAD